ncbi:RNA-directed DNA polymerase [Chloroflexota bacterium]
MAINVAEDSLDWALAHAERYGDTDVFPIPFEFQAIRFSWEEVRTRLSRRDLDTRPVEELRRCIAPKGLYSYRVVTQLDPIDFLLYTALTYEIGEHLESIRVPAGENIVHSSRFNPSADGRMFDQDYNYSSFLIKCRAIAEDGSYSYVVVADISDFYPRIYLHRIESALQLGTAREDISRGILKLIKGWNDNVSYGIPVGSAASRLIAEATLDDIDKYLISTDTTYCRYSDDFRIFCKSKVDAYAKLELLASILFENHGLFLQPSKTEIVDMDKFEKKYLETPVTTELLSLRERFGDILDSLGIEDLYTEIDYDELEDEEKKAIDSLNLHGLLMDQIGKEVVDTGILKFVLSRMGQLNQHEGIEEIFNNINKCYHLVPNIVSYIKLLKDIEGENRDYISGKAINIISSSIIGQLPFNRCWILSLFSDNIMRTQVQNLAQMFNRYTDTFSQRKVILSLGCMRQDYWFRNMKSSVMHLSPWSRRALLVASSCMAADEVKAWYGSINRRLDELENIVIDWVKSYAFQ